MRKTKAFSLIELSIVILVIGILISGITQSRALIFKSRLSNARNITTSSSVGYINGLVLWLDTCREGSFLDSQTDNGSQLTTWIDIHPLMSKQLYALKTASENVTYLKHSNINSLPAVQFSTTTSYSNTYFSIKKKNDATSSMIQTGITSNDFTIFLVLRTSSQTSGASNIFTNGAFDHYKVSFTLDSSQRNAFYMRKPYVALRTSNNTAKIDEPHILVLDYDRTNSLATMYINGEQVAQTSTGDEIANPSTHFVIGSDNNGASSYWVGQLSEFMYYGNHLKNKDREEVEEYLSQKFNIDLVS